MYISSVMIVYMSSEIYKFRISYLAEQFGVFVLEQHYNKKALHLTASNDQAPYDIEIDGLKIDVKYSQPTRISKNKPAPYWDFDLRKKGNEYCDYLLLIGARNGLFDSVYLVPCSDANYRRIRIPIGGISKWGVYKIR